MAVSHGPSPENTDIYPPILSSRKRLWLSPLPQQIGVLGPQGADLVEVVFQKVLVSALVIARLGGGQGAAGVVQLLLELLVRGQGVGTRPGAFPPVQLVYA